MFARSQENSPPGNAGATFQRNTALVKPIRPSGIPTQGIRSSLVAKRRFFRQLIN